MFTLAHPSLTVGWYYVSRSRHRSARRECGAGDTQALYALATRANRPDIGLETVTGSISFFLAEVALGGQALDEHQANNVMTRAQALPDEADDLVAGARLPRLTPRSASSKGDQSCQTIAGSGIGERSSRRSFSYLW